MSYEGLALHYVLGALSPVEHDALTLVRLYDRSLEQAIADLESQLAAQFHPGSGASPPAELWGRIASALAQERASLKGTRVETFPDGPWAVIAPGAEAKRVGDGYAKLLRCDPGPVAWSYCRVADEHVLVIAGDLCVGDRRFITGDYLFSAADDRIAALRTDGGCVLLVF